MLYETTTKTRRREEGTARRRWDSKAAAVYTRQKSHYSINKTLLKQHHIKHHRLPVLLLSALFFYCGRCLGRAILFPALFGGDILRFLAVYGGSFDSGLFLP